MKTLTAGMAIRFIESLTKIEAALKSASNSVGWGELDFALAYAQAMREHLMMLAVGDVAVEVRTAERETV